jgi:hypothetical protein
LSSRRKLLRLLSLISGILVILFSLFLVARLDWFHYFYGGSEMGRGVNYFEYYGYRLFILILIGAVFILGIALIVASYYRHGETDMAVKSESITV